MILKPTNVIMLMFARILGHPQMHVSLILMNRSCTVFNNKLLTVVPLQSGGGFKGQMIELAWACGVHSILGYIFHHVCICHMSSEEKYYTFGPIPWYVTNK